MTGSNIVTQDQVNALSKPVVKVAYFAEFSFKSDTLRVSTLNKSFTWGGVEWLGAGTIGSVSDITEEDSTETTGLTFTLNISNAQILALGVGSAEEYRGRPCKMYMCPLDENFRLVGDPVVCWTGVMDLLTVGIENSEGKIELKCENSAYSLKRQPILRLNATQRKLKYPNDKGLDFLVDLIANQQTWLSKNFQKI